MFFVKLFILYKYIKLYHFKNKVKIDAERNLASTSSINIVDLNVRLISLVLEKTGEKNEILISMVLPATQVRQHWEDWPKMKESKKISLYSFKNGWNSDILLESIKDKYFSNILLY